MLKKKSTDELLDHYHLADRDILTNLGVLWLGKRNDRSNLLYAPTIQFFKFDERGEKVNRLFWDDHSLNPKELIGKRGLMCPMECFAASFPIMPRRLCVS
jgi:ATP-dependent DNA helicase RecG